MAYEEQSRDLGFGAVVASQRRRLLNRDGSFNVARQGLNWFLSHSLYHDLLTTTWPRFLGLVVLFYLVTNTVFAFAFLACGPDALAGEGTASGGPFLRAFFFSVQTFATIGYGAISPRGMAANWLVALESLVGLLGFALATGLLFARFSRPTAKILFSEAAVVAPYRGGTAFELRIANARSNELIELEAKLMLTRFREEDDGTREFLPLALERHRVAFFPLSWTIVHPIDESSPLHGMTPERLRDAEAEFLVLLTGIDETFSQTVHARSSYTADEVVWGARFTNLFNPPAADGVLSIDVGRLDEIEPAELPGRPRIAAVIG